MEPLLIIIIFLSFFCTFLIIPFWIRKTKEMGLIWEDMNKINSGRNVAGSGGIVVVLGAMIGIFAYVAVQTFYFKNYDGILTGIFAILSSMFLMTGVGLMDDLFGWKKGGMSIRSRVILVVLSAIPLMVINVGDSTMFGINLGIIYPLVIIPLGFLGATTTFNMIAGFNGLEAGQGIILLSAIAMVTYLTGTPWLSIVALCMVAALFAFYLFNMNPAKVFPGDVLTFSVGAMLAAIAIIGNIEKIALFFFIPYAMEVVLKIRGKIEMKNVKGFAQNFGVPREDRSLELRYNKIYSVTHLSLYILKKFKKKVYEEEVVWLINGFQILIVLIGFLLFL